MFSSFAALAVADSAETAVSPRYYRLNANRQRQGTVGRLRAKQNDSGQRAVMRMTRICDQGGLQVNRSISTVNEIIYGSTDQRQVAW